MFYSFSTYIFILLLSSSCLSQLSFLPFSSDADIILPPNGKNEEITKVLIIVPGGKVPNENYTLIGKSIQNFSNFNLWVGIPKCLANLCDPLDPTPFGLNSAIERTIGKINASMSYALQSSSVVISGHSLGATGARHFFDVNPNYLGLILFGTQYIGDHEDFKGTLGYPVSLSSFLSPLLIVTGELDSLPFTHAARIFDQRENLNEDEKKKKVVVVIEGLDHSDFCPNYKVAGDIFTELSQNESTSKIGEVVGAWLNLQVLEGEKVQEAEKIITKYSEESKKLFTPFLEAIKMDKTEWCELAQKIISGLNENEWDSLYVRGIEVIGSNSDLQHAHNNFSFLDNDNKTLLINVPSYPYYEEIQNFSYATHDSGARDISCKMISAERIAQLFNRSIPEFSHQKSCKDVNEIAFAKAKELVQKYHPSSLERYEKQGIPPKFMDDNYPFIGPQWVYLTSLNLDRQTGEIVSPDMYSSLNSFAYPGVRYCKLLSPARAIEYLMSTGLARRYLAKISE